MTYTKMKIVSIVSLFFTSITHAQVISSEKAADYIVTKAEMEKISFLQSEPAEIFQLKKHLQKNKIHVLDEEVYSMNKLSIHGKQYEQIKLQPKFKQYIDELDIHGTDISQSIAYIFEQKIKLSDNGLERFFITNTYILIYTSDSIYQGAIKHTTQQIGNLLTESKYLYLAQNVLGVEEKIQTTTLSCIPNPASSILSLKVESNEPQINVDISIHDMTGKYIMKVVECPRLPIGVHNYRIDVSTLAQGVYYVSFRTINNSSYSKLIINR